MRHDFWVADMADVDWDGAADEYRPLLDRIATESEFADVLWEVFGELGTSHAYVIPPGGGDGRRGRPAAARRRPGPDGRRAGGSGGSCAARPPIRGRARRWPGPARGIAAGDLLVAIDGRPVGPDGPGPLLAGTAGKPVELDGRRPADRRQASCAASSSCRSAATSACATRTGSARKRAEVRELSGGRVGYLHVPDMVSEGWADFHRDLRSEMLRDALIMDVRGNSGGHTSQLVVEKLARRVIGWDMPRGMRCRRPTRRTRRAARSSRSPMSARARTATSSPRRSSMLQPRARSSAPGPGAASSATTTQHELVDGTPHHRAAARVLVERLRLGRGELRRRPRRRGASRRPDDWAAGRDAQLRDRRPAGARGAALAAPAARPPDPATRPSRRRPSLPPRSG